MSKLPDSAGRRSRMRDIVKGSQRALIGVIVLSGVVNLLALTGSIYMLQVYDRVLPSRSLATLAGLTVLMVVLYAAFGLLEVVRTRVMTRVGRRFERALRDRVLAVMLLDPPNSRLIGLQPVHDLDQVRSFIGGPGLMAVFDLPWLPIYLLLAFCLHYWIGLAAVGAAVVLGSFALLMEAKSREALKASSRTGRARQTLGDALLRNAETIKAMGLERRLGARWAKLNEALLGQQARALDATGGIGAASRTFRAVLQSALLGLGALLVIGGDATAGVMIAGSIIVAKALAPIEMLIGNWKSFANARDSWWRLGHLLQAVPVEKTAIALPRPTRTFAADGLVVGAARGERPILQDVSFTLEAGDGLGIIGPCGSGKSTLARTIVGAIAALRGTVRLDEAVIDQWLPEALGRDIGYLPQDVQLFAASVAENIARFDDPADSESVIAAAQAAGVHRMILHLPHGYDTQVGEGGAMLSAGQRQQIALARALYGDPFLVVLDEPNSNLDDAGDQALTAAIRSVRRRGGIAIVITHREQTLEALDKLLVLASGRVRFFGNRDALRTPSRTPPLSTPAKQPSPAGSIFGTRLVGLHSASEGQQ